MSQYHLPSYSCR